LDNSTTAADRTFLRRAMQLALQAEREGNLPIGAVIALDGAIIAEGYNHIWAPVPAHTRHAEMEALRVVDPSLWPRAAEMSLYTTLEPCMMCAGAILLHKVGRVVFGAGDDYGGMPLVAAHLPPYFQAARAAIRWEGPALPEECGALFAQAMALIAARGEGRPPA
jgi:tRNA(adenine34) deaminase